MTEHDPCAFIARAKWVFAKTMAHYNPHWYVVEAKEAGADFDAFVALIRTTPIRRYRGGRYHCLTVDEFDYWLTHAGGGGWIINRKKTVDANWDDVPPSYDRADKIRHDLEREIITAEQARARLLALGADAPDDQLTLDL